MAAAFKRGPCLGIRRRHDTPCVSSPAGIVLRCLAFQKRASFSEFTLDLDDGFHEKAFQVYYLPLRNIS